MTRTALANSDSLTLEVITPNIGATVVGVDLRAVDAQLTARLRKELVERQVLVFPNQHLTPTELLRFIKGFGELDEGVIRTKSCCEDEPDVVVLDTTSPGSAGDWHTDHTFTACPPMAACLQAIQLPGSGGDTGFASMFAAYDALSPSMRGLLDGLSGVYSTEPLLRRFAVEDRNVPEESQKLMSAIHPLVRTHPESGRKSLFFPGEVLVRIRELTQAESDTIIAMLREHVKHPVFQCRVRWQVGTITLWDERSTLHCAIGDYNERRVMYRLMLKGDQPK